MNEIKEDLDFEDVEIREVTKHEDGYTLERADGWSFFCPDVGIEPKSGDTARFFGKGIGSIVRGLFINGQEIFYRTPEEQKEQNQKDLIEGENRQREEFEQKRKSLDADYNALPENFRRRLDRFRANNPDFRWKFESYEMVCLRDAVKISKAFETAEQIKDFAQMDWEAQMKFVPNLDEGHSGNTFGFAVRLAYLNKTTPELVEKEHGAMCPLVGCKDYGCFSMENKS
jgi:hypothetical protein